VKNYEQKTADSGKLIKAVYVWYIYVDIINKLWPCIDWNHPVVLSKSIRSLFISVRTQEIHLLSIYKSGKHVSAH
jgi:hypothetical protein